MPDPVSVWTIAESIGTASAAAFAAVQIYLSRRDGNSRAVFEHLKEIDRRLQETWSAPADEVGKELLAYYRNETSEITPRGRNYLSLLNSLDVLAFAVKKKIVDQETVDEYICTLINPNVLSLTFLKEFQECCGDSSVYEHLYEYFTALRSRVRTAQSQLKRG